jgi:hypothetical protein
MVDHELLVEFAAFGTTKTRMRGVAGRSFATEAQAAARGGAVVGA